MSLLNIVIHMLFAIDRLLSIAREMENKSLYSIGKKKVSHEYQNKFPVNCTLCLTHIRLAARNLLYLFTH
jgi:hypothetical protein